MAIQWTGLFANTGYSSANNKTQDDAVTGMQDTLYVTGPGYGAYEAVVKLHNSTGAVVATVNVSGGGGAFSAPPPVRFVDNGTVYSYSLEVVRGYIPTEDADGIMIRLVGGASKRYPSPMTSTPSGDVAVARAITASAFLDAEGNPVGTVSSLKKAFTSLWDPTVQILANWTTGFYITAAGVPTSSASSRISAFIPVIPGTRVYITTSETAPGISGAYFTDQSTPYGSGPGYNTANVIPAGVNWMKINMTTTWTTVPVVITFGVTTAAGKMQFIGDSITVGFTNAGTVARPFPTVVGERFSADVVNTGSSGSTLATGAGSNNPFATRFASIDRGASCHFILYGTNDARNGIPIGTIEDAVDTTFYGAYNLMMAYITKVCPGSRIVLGTPNKYGSASYGGGNTFATQETFAEAVRLLGTKWCVPVVDCNARGPMNLNTLAHKYTFGDVGGSADLHFNQQGYIRLGEWIANELEPLLFPQVA